MRSVTVAADLIIYTTLFWLFLTIMQTCLIKWNILACVNKGKVKISTRQKAPTRFVFEPCMCCLHIHIYYICPFYMRSWEANYLSITFYWLFLNSAKKNTIKTRTTLRMCVCASSWLTSAVDLTKSWLLLAPRLGLKPCSLATELLERMAALLSLGAQRLRA